MRYILFLFCLFTSFNQAYGMEDTVDDDLTTVSVTVAMGSNSLMYYLSPFNTISHIKDLIETDTEIPVSCQVLRSATSPFGTMHDQMTLQKIMENYIVRLQLSEVSHTKE